MKIHTYARELVESFDSKMDITYVQKSRGEMSASATIGGVLYTLTANTEYSPLDNDVFVEILFGNVSADGTMNLDQTNTGSELQVFSFVVQAMGTVIAKMNPRDIRFGAKNDNGKGNRASLYKRLAQRLAVKYGYKTFNQPHRQADSVLFYLKK